jgi:HD superfamily phosphohydrolase
MAGLPPEVRDPLHGAIAVSRRELAVLDHPLMQRLRGIRQLGFSDLSFPGATHNRYIHSVGAMHLAGRAFDSVFDDPALPPVRDADRDRLRRLIRCAALLHDVGHAPFSHTTEFAMPALGTLEVPVYAADRRRWNPSRRATHEDYTIKIVTDSSLTQAVEASIDAPAVAVAGLIDPHIAVDPDHYRAGGVDFRPLLQQLISSELDVDRMDYLARDSLYAGVHYGVFDTGCRTARSTPSTTSSSPATTCS